MKIYFSNNKYLTINSVHEEYRRGYKYLEFDFEKSELTLDALLNFLTTDNILNKIIITNQQNEVLVSLENVYKAVYSIVRMLNEEGVVSFRVQLTSGNGTDIPANVKAGEEDKE